MAPNVTGTQDSKTKDSTTAAGQSNPTVVFNTKFTVRELLALLALCPMDVPVLSRSSNNSGDLQDELNVVLHDIEGAPFLVIEASPKA